MSDELDREFLGQIVRKVWVAYCIETNHVYKPDHVDSWEQLDEWAKEVDRRIGETVAAHAHAAGVAAERARVVALMNKAIRAARADHDMATVVIMQGLLDKVRQ